MPGLGANAPRPGQSMPGVNDGSLKVPNTAHAVRSVDETGGMTGVIPVAGRAQAISSPGPQIPGVEPTVVRGSSPVIPETPTVPVGSTPKPTPVSQLPTPGAPIPPSTTGMIPQTTPGSAGNPNAPYPQRAMVPGQAGRSMPGGYPWMPPGTRPVPGGRHGQPGIPAQMPPQMFTQAQGNPPNAPGAAGTGQRPGMPGSRPGMPGGYPPMPGAPGMPGMGPRPGMPGGYPPMPGAPGMPGMGPRPGMPGGYPPMPGQPMPGMGPRPGMPPMPGMPYGMWGRPNPYGYPMRYPGMPMLRPIGYQPPRSANRETLEDMEARQIQELKEAEEASHRAEIEAIKSQALRENEELSDEDLDNIDWDEFEETFTERIIRKAGRWGETLLMLGQAARWAFVVLVAVTVVMALVYALDRSATQTVASGEETQPNAQVVLETPLPSIDFGVSTA